MSFSPRSLLQRPRILLVILLILVKSALVLALTDSFFYGEELEKGTAAKAMLDGLAVPHHQLAYHYYEGGGFVISHLKALAFLLVGENLLANKLVAIAFNVGILLAGYSFTRRAFGERAALWFGILFVCGPESFQKLSLISLGIHFEACLFLFGVLGLGARVTLDENPRPAHWFCLGLVTGFGFYFSYQVAVAAIWVVLGLLCFRTRALLSRGALLGLAGTAVGALPLAVMYALVGGAVFDVHGTSLGAGFGENLQLLREQLASVFLEGTLGDRIAPFCWLGAVLLGLAFLVSRRGEPERSSRRHALYLAGYLALFLVVYLNSGFVQGRVEYYFSLMRLAPLWLLSTPLVAGAIGRLAASPDLRGRRAATVLGAFLIALALRSTYLVLETGRPASPVRNGSILWRTKGYDYDQYFAKVLPHFDGEVGEKLELVEGFDEAARGLLRADAAVNLFLDPSPDLVTAYGEAMETIRARGADREAQYVLGLGPLLVRGSQWDQARAVASVAAAEPAARAGLYEALGRFGGGRHPLPEFVRPEVERGLRLAEPEPYLRGVGRWIYRRFRIDPEAAASFIGEQPEAARAALSAGYEAERRWHTLDR